MRTCARCTGMRSTHATASSATATRCCSPAPTLPKALDGAAVRPRPNLPGPRRRGRGVAMTTAVFPGQVLKRGARDTPALRAVQAALEQAGYGPLAAGVYDAAMAA